MSGIAGIFRFDGKDVRRDELEVMAEAVSHRGPDGVEFFTDSHAGLVSLSFLTEAGMHKPFYFADNAVAFDGRIDNLPTLSRMLKRKKAPPHDAGNAAQIISLSYDYLNPVFPRCLLGDFAIALWDSKVRALTLVRDPFGIKPLYYYKDSQRFIFASEIKAILSLPGIQRKPNTRIVEQYKRGRHHTFTETFFENIFRLPPAAIMKIHSDGTLSQKTYWEINPRRKIRMKNRKAYLSRFRKLFLDAVERRLPKSGTCAVSLSGGLDSSSILGAASYLKPSCRLLAVSHLSREFPDEREHIQKVVTETRADLEAVFLEDTPLLEGIEDALYHQESPFYDPEDSFLLQRFKTAKERGARALLTGEWGDQTHGGNGYLADNFLSGKFVSFYNDIKILPKYHGGLPLENIRYILKLLFFNSPLRHLTWRKHFGQTFPTCAQREMYEELFHPLHVLLLETLDKMAALAGVELRFPFLDRRLLQFLIAIPSEERIREGLGKQLLREGLKGILCEAIAKRTDKGDTTELAAASLKKAGFTTGESVDLRNQWKNDMIAKWEELWIKNNREGTRKDPCRKTNESLTGNPR